jgi:hypothetical protein
MVIGEKMSMKRTKEIGLQAEYPRSSPFKTTLRALSFPFLEGLPTDLFVGE